MPERERRDLEAAHPRPPHEVPEVEAPLPDEIPFRILPSDEIASFVALALLVAGLGSLAVLVESLLLGALAFALAIHVVWFARSLLRSPHRLQRRGEELRITFRDGEEKSWPISALSLRVRSLDEYGHPLRVELLDGEGEKIAEVWTGFLTNAELLLRLIPPAKSR